MAHLSWKRISPKAAKLTPEMFARILAGCEAFATAIAGQAGATAVRVALDKAKPLVLPDVEGGRRYPPFTATTTNPNVVSISRFMPRKGSDEH
jgi:hypothetical protein